MGVSHAYTVELVLFELDLLVSKAKSETTEEGNNK
jgi:hypothetical protein